MAYETKREMITSKEKLVGWPNRGLSVSGLRFAVGVWRGSLRCVPHSKHISFHIDSIISSFSFHFIPVFSLSLFTFSKLFLCVT
jgi:hypothetical protein